MTYLFKSATINYEVVGEGDVQLVFLHGWGGQIDSFKFICKYLKFDFKALFIDFPPFGKSTQMDFAWTMFDYVELTLGIMREVNFIKPIVIGHSFGGRVATLLASGGYAGKLMLVDSAGLKPKRTLKYKFKCMINKLKAKMDCKNIKGSKDYEALSPVMKKTFVNIVNTFLEKYANIINIPTYIFWGAKDRQTPLYMARRFNALIKGSELVIIKNAGHFAYLDDLNTFVNVLNLLVKI